MKRKMPKLGLAGWVLLGTCVHAVAGQDVSVGRVDVQLPGDGWEVYSVEDKGNEISGSGLTYQQTTEFKVFARRGSDNVLDALILVRANASGKGRFSGIVYSNAACAGSSKVFAEGDEPRPAARSFRCLRVAQWNPIASSSAIPDGAREWLTKNGWRFPPNMFVVSAVQHATTGAFAGVIAYLRPLATNPVDTRTRGTPAELPSGVMAPSVEWGRQLQEAVTDSVYSIRGKLHVPALRFEDVAHETPSLLVDPKPPATPAHLPVPSLSNRG